MLHEHTIVALSTPQGLGAIGVIRLSGKRAIELCSQVVRPALHEVAANQAVFGRFVVDEKVLDEVVATVFRAPKSYTGEDVVELSFHGSSYILNAAMQALLNAGAQLASPGEFTQRAFLKGKLDLSQAEAVADLIASESEAEHRLAMHQMRGGFSQEIAKLREELIHFASLIELELDFAEEDVEFADRDELVELVRVIQGYIERLIDSFRYGNAIKHGVPVAIIGKPNAGKSTLLNALLNEDKAIVSDIAGTTRDAIEDVAVIEGVRFRFIDTAGLRDTEDVIESLGVQRSLEKMRSAALVIYLFDATEDWPEHEAKIIALMEELAPKGTEVIPVANKSDMLASPSEFNQPVIAISAKHLSGLDTLHEALLNRINTTGAGQGDVVVTNARHLQALKATHHALKQSLEAIAVGLSGDLIAADIREALHHLGSITGEISTDDLLGNIFGKFCIGK
jgi:tRNA modification GTPase